MNILGLSAGFHDGAATVLSPCGDILFAAHSERYSKKKNDPNLDLTMLKSAISYGIKNVAWFERPWMHNIQQWRSGQRLYQPWRTNETIKQHMGEAYNSTFSINKYSHHLSHAAAGFQTSPFQEAAVVVIDAIGELDTISIYHAQYDNNGIARYRRMWRQIYPHSIGLFYSAITKKLGLKPMDEEYITMGMAAYGSDQKSDWIKEQYFSDIKTARLTKNLHIGFDENELSSFKDIDIAASAQKITEELISNIIARARLITNSDQLVYMGGVALNCVANSKVLPSYFNKIWIMPNPGDAGSSLGAAALLYGRKLNWKDAFLGHEIYGDYPVDSLIQDLLKNKIVGVASGRAEFGPRALGNRSLLADPRGTDIKNLVNEIKRRQKFRPFAPVILEEKVHDFFKMPLGWETSRYMQVTGQCYAPQLYPAIVHVDGSSRIQTVPDDGSGIRMLLERWYQLTKCPMLLNTSLNIRGEPMVNDRDDAVRFEKFYGVKVCS